MTDKVTEHVPALRAFTDDPLTTQIFEEVLATARRTLDVDAIVIPAFLARQARVMSFPFFTEHFAIMLALTCIAIVVEVDVEVVVVMPSGGAVVEVVLVVVLVVVVVLAVQGVYPSEEYKPELQGIRKATSVAATEEEGSPHEFR